MKKVLSKVMAAAVVAALFAGAVLSAATSVQTRRDENRQGMMPEVVCSAEVPRLVMPTVEVRAFRTVAVSSTADNVF